MLNKWGLVFRCNVQNVDVPDNIIKDDLTNVLTPHVENIIFNKTVCIALIVVWLPSLVIATIVGHDRVSKKK
jgi:hypothetical protein